MARDMAWISTWGRPVAGREKQSLEVFMEFMQFWAGQAAEGKIEPLEVYSGLDGADSVAIVRGKSDALMAIAESEDARKLLEKGHMIVEGLKTHWYWVGSDEEIQTQTRLYAEAGSELGYM